MTIHLFIYSVVHDCDRRNWHNMYCVMHTNIFSTVFYGAGRTSNHAKCQWLGEQTWVMSPTICRMSHCLR